jgi:hypothetical protein
MDDSATPLACSVEYAHCLQAVGHLLGEPTLEKVRAEEEAKSRD